MFKLVLARLIEVDKAILVYRQPSEQSEEGQRVLVKNPVYPSTREVEKLMHGRSVQETDIQVEHQADVEIGEEVQRRQEDSSAHVPVEFDAENFGATRSEDGQQREFRVHEDQAKDFEEFEDASSDISENFEEDEAELGAA